MRENNSISLKKLKSFLQWESFNWGRGIGFWFEVLKKYSPDWEKVKVLEIGGGWRGEISLIFAHLGAKKVVCSDINKKSLEKAKELHQKYNQLLKTQITYEVIDALKIPYDVFFTIIAFKSVLGGVSKNGRNELKYQMIKEIYKALAPEGYLLFVENLEGCLLHKFLRKKIY